MSLIDICGSCSCTIKNAEKNTYKVILTSYYKGYVEGHILFVCKKCRNSFRQLGLLGEGSSVL